MQTGGAIGTQGAFQLLARESLRAQELAAASDPRRAAKQFESLFATQLVREMRKTLDEGFFGSGAGSDVYEGWLDEHLGGALANGRGLGLEDAIAASLGAHARAGATEAAR
jgi:flagellar protein FlgJ